jgi:hypothetical protein
MRKALIIGAAAAALGLAGSASAKQWEDWAPTQGFWTMTVIKVDSNKIDDYLVGLKEGWQPGQELAKKNGLIDDYKIMVNTAPAAAIANVVLMTHIPSGAALDPNKERDQRLEKEGLAMVPKKRQDELVSGYDKMRTFVDDGLWQEVKFVK